MHLRIDNGWRSVSCGFCLTSEAMSCTLTSYIPKHRSYYSLSVDVSDILMRFHFI